MTDMTASKKAYTITYTYNSKTTLSLEQVFSLEQVMLGGDEIYAAEAQFSQSKIFLTTITLLLILDLHTYLEKVLLDMNSDNKTFTSGHSFEI